MSLVAIKINGQEVSVSSGLTVLQACESVGVTVPRFCYHERLSIAGNCRMCLVEIENAPKLAASCALPLMPSMSIWTDTPAVKRAREGVLEFLLINHPLDCPICDQGGECDLQDQAMVYGSDRGRFQEYKRAVEDKPCGPLVQTIMTRCIHCTRCIRFTSEIAGTGELGTTGRGQQMEVGTYLTKALSSELSANVIDLCPVGALTSKPYAFTARSWELTSTEGIDSTDAVGSHIRYDTRGAEVLRILPRLCEDINETWISDKARYCYDGLRYHRAEGASQPTSQTSTSWSEGFTQASEAVYANGTDGVDVIVGASVDQETLGCLTKMQGGMPSGLSHLYRENLTSYEQWGEGTSHRVWMGERSMPVDFRMHHRATAWSTLDDADQVVMVGTHWRHEAALVNARLRGRMRKGSPCQLHWLGSPASTTLPVTHWGTTAETLVLVAEGRHPLCALLKKAAHPVVCFGRGVMDRMDASMVWSVIRMLTERVPHLTVWYLPAFVNEVGHYEMGVGTTAPTVTSSSCLWIQPDQGSVKGMMRSALMSDEEASSSLTEGVHVVMSPYQSQGEGADYLFASHASSEMTGEWVNGEGRVQVTRSAVTPSWSSKSLVSLVGTWAAFRPQGSVTEPLGTREAVNAEMSIRYPRSSVTVGKRSDWEQTLRSEVGSRWSKGQWGRSPLRTWVDSFYQTDVLTRHSSVLSQCVRQLTPEVSGRTTSGSAWKQMPLSI